MKIDIHYISNKKEPILQKLLSGELPTEKEQGQLELLTQIEKDLQVY